MVNDQRSRSCMMPPCHNAGMSFPPIPRTVLTPEDSPRTAEFNINLAWLPMQDVNDVCPVMDTVNTQSSSDGCSMIEAGPSSSHGSSSRDDLSFRLSQQPYYNPGQLLEGLQPLLPTSMPIPSFDLPPHYFPTEIVVSNEDLAELPKTQVSA